MIVSRSRADPCTVSPPVLLVAARAEVLVDYGSVVQPKRTSKPGLPLPLQASGADLHLGTVKSARSKVVVIDAFLFEFYIDELMNNA